MGNKSAVRLVRQNKKKDGSNYNIYTDGLKIYTTINSHMQQYAEDAIKEHLGDFLQPLFFKENKEVRTPRMQGHCRRRGWKNC